MHCIVLSSEAGEDGWRIRRSVEVLAYHRARREVSILFALLAENRAPRDENSLRILHRGNVCCTLVPPWPLPRHPDERGTDRVRPTRGVLSSVYGRLFRQHDGGVVWAQKLSSWDSEEPTTGEILLHTAHPVGRTVLEPDCPPPDDGYVPFTTWTMSFDRPGYHLLAFELSFSGETYDRLLPDERVFTVDGPQRLVGRIEYEDMGQLSETERSEWLARLESFRDPTRRLSCADYDVIVLGPPHAERVERAEWSCANGVYEAPRQPREGNALRYRTTDPLFTLPLTYAENAERQPLAYGKVASIW